MSACEALLRFKYLFLSILSNLFKHPIKALFAFSLRDLMHFEGLRHIKLLLLKYCILQNHINLKFFVLNLYVFFVINNFSSLK